MTDDSRIRGFFDTFTDDSATADCFADPFLLAEPGGARPVPLGSFLAALPARRRAFADAGLGPAQLTALSHERLDAHYLLARTRWETPRLDGGEPVPLESSYLLHDDGSHLRVVLYLNHVGVG
jgi:hypothetical protein